MKKDKKNILIFSDPGLDDALAIVWLLSHKDINVIGTVPVAGNHSVSQVTENMVKILTKTGSTNVPVYNTISVKQKFHQLPNIHGEDAIGDFIPDQTNNEICIKEFENIYKDTIDVDYEIISLAPCTVLARFLQNAITEPYKITFMGGLRNVEANFNGTEFNIGIDEESAKNIFKYSICPINMVPLDVTRQYFLPDEISVIKDTDNDTTKFFKDLCKSYINLALKRGKKAFPHDLTAAVSMMNGYLFSWENGSITLDGFKIVLENGTKDKLAANIIADPNEFESVIMEGLDAL